MAVALEFVAVTSTDSLSYSYQTSPLTLREVLEASNFAGTEVLTGRKGLDRVVASVNVMENPDIVPWIKAGELLITVGYSLLGASTDLAALVEKFADTGLAGFGIKLGPYITEIDPEALAMAESRDFPILALPPTVSFDDLIADVYQSRDSMLLGGLHRKSDREQELMSVALSGGSPAQIAERLAELVHCEVMVVGLGQEVVAHRLGTATTPPPRDPHDSLQFDDAISAPIVFGSTYVGQLHVFPADGPDGDFFPGLVPTCAQIMALAASREIAVASVDRQFRAEFLEQVLLNRLESEEIARRCQALEWQLQLPAVIVTLSPAALDATPYLERVRDMLDWALRPRGLHAPRAIVGGEVVAIVGSDQTSSDDPETVAMAALTEVLGRSVPEMWSAGISDPVETIADLEQGWLQARMATKVTRSVKGVGEIGRFAELGVYRLLIDIDPARREDFARQVLGELFDPAEGKAELRRTLAVLLESNMNLAETARQLHYHYNSIRYRTTQLEKMLGPFLTDPIRRLELHVALLICEMIAPIDDVRVG